MLTTQKQIAQSFWNAHPEFKSDYRKSFYQDEYKTDIRCAFGFYVDHLQRDGQISMKLAQRATLIPFESYTIDERKDEHGRKYKVFKVGRKSARRKILARGLSLDEAKQMVKRYPDSSRSMVCFTKQ